MQRKVNWWFLGRIKGKVCRKGEPNLEERNKNTMDLDCLSILEVCKKMNEEDKKVAYAVEEQLPVIEKAVEAAISCIRSGGRVFYIGSGTSGKIGVLDASECPPTFGVEDEMIQGIISGGLMALSGCLEDTEDDEELAVKDLENKNVNEKDLLIGISASGNTPYVKSAMNHGKEIGCKTVGIMCRQDGVLKNICDIVIAMDVGAEVIMGSTRLKAGTAQKMVVNMISTTTMIKLGKTYSNLMVNVRPINRKLKNRVIEIVQLATGKDRDTVEVALEAGGYDPKIAIVSIQKGLDASACVKLLEEHNWNVYQALESHF